jgi:hypothetical protein
MKKTKKMLKAIIYAGSFLLFPITALAVDWGVGVSTDRNGISGISIGVGSNMGGWALANPYGLPQGSILGIASNILFWLLAIFAILGIIGFLISGIMYLVSAGDDETISKAKNAMKYSIIGIIIGLSGYLIMQAVLALLGGNSKTF